MIITIITATPHAIPAPITMATGTVCATETAGALRIRTATAGRTRPTSEPTTTAIKPAIALPQEIVATTAMVLTAKVMAAGTAMGTAIRVAYTAVVTDTPVAFMAVA